MTMIIFKRKKYARGVILTIALMIAATLFMPDTAFAAIALNGAGDGFDEGDPPGGTADRSSSGPVSIEDYIIRGIGYYLEAKANADGLLEMAEAAQSGVNGTAMDDMKQAAANAAANMDEALDTFNGLIQKAEATPYNSEFTGRLEDFDYDTFGTENGLNRDVLENLEGYLANGDIVGVFKRYRTGFVNIAAGLNGVKSEIDNGNVPALTGLWQLNETFSDLSLFGSYAARVFKEISE
ncbi:MAG: hypothetical protein GY940_10270 [bacterium]|nr:hypothetical protein [bacterium]